MTTQDWIGVISTLATFGAVFALGGVCVFMLIKDAVILK